MQKEKSKYKSISEWKLADPKAYNVAIQKGLIRIICEKFGWKIHKQNGYWKIKKNVLEDAQKFETKQMWKKSNSAPYKSAIENGWLEECCKHMITSKKTKKDCKKDAKKYKTKTEWLKKSKSFYHYAHEKGWLNECCKHMISIKKPNGYWTFEHCKEDAKNFKTTKEWASLSPSSYAIAKSNGWLDGCRLHMNEKKRLPKGYWTKEKCKEDAKKHNGRFEWQIKSGGAYRSAHKNKWLEECCSHMK